jgi:hypothetical protein
MPPAISVPADDSQFSMSSFMDLLRIDLKSISDSLLVGITQLVLAKGGSRLLVDLANEIINRDGQKSNQGLSVAYSILMEYDPDISSKLRYAEKMEAIQLAAGKPVGRYVLLQVNLLNQMGKPDAASELMLGAARKYQSDPEMIAFFQQMRAMQQQPRGGDESRLAGASRPAAGDQPSIILPGQSSAAQGESKLWLPGT